MAREKKLPVRLFVIRKSNGRDEWFESVESVEMFAQIGETIPVGEYQLVKTVKVTGIVKVE